jgi:hypothetical protein
MRCNQDVLNGTAICIRNTNWKTLKTCKANAAATSCGKQSISGENTVRLTRHGENSAAAGARPIKKQLNNPSDTRTIDLEKN